MPDYVPIQDLTIVGSVGDNDLFPMSDGSGAYAVKGSTIKSYAASDAASAAADAEASKTAAQAAASNAANSATAAQAAQAAAEAVGPSVTAAQNDMISHKYDHVIDISANTDLNTLTEPRTYRCALASTAATLVNCPVSSIFRMEVIKTTSSRYVQIIIANSNFSGMYIRRYDNGSWSRWFDLVTNWTTIQSSAVLITSENYLTYFPNGSFNDAPQNTIYTIAGGVPLANAPVSYANNVGAGSAATPPNGTLLTFTYNTNTSTVFGLVQLFVGYRPALNYYPTFSYRIAATSSGNYVWSRWSNFTENGYLHATNAFVYDGHLDETFTDLNDARKNTIYQIDKNCTEGVLANHPCPGVSSVLITYAFSASSNHGKVQTLFNLNNEMYFRYGYLQASDDYRWTAWAKVSSKIPDPPSENGTYILQCTVSGASKTYAWVAV